MEQIDPTPAWHPEVIDLSEVAAAPDALWAELGTVGTKIATTFDTLSLPRLQRYVRQDDSSSLRVAWDRRPMYAGWVVVADVTLPLTPHSPRICYRVGLTNGIPQVLVEKESLQDIMTRTVRKGAGPPKQRLETVVPGLGANGVSTDELTTFLSDLRISWAMRQIELGV
jgi:hypothetical protein